MGQLLIRKLRDATLARYRALARINGRSLEAEARHQLERGAEAAATEKRELSRRIRALTANPRGSVEGWQLIREDRDRR
jgi:plasmid stability protein